MDEFAADPPVEERLGDALRETDATLAIAESCTGGLAGSLVTDVPGASDYFDRAVCTYSYEAKMRLLGVSRESLDAEGAVSEAVAREMASGVRDTAGTTWGVATTGIAGPSGGTPEKPVGTVYVAVAHRGEWGSGETTTQVARHECDGDRLQRKERFARRALADLLAAVEDRRERL